MHETSTAFSGASVTRRVGSLGLLQDVGHREDAATGAFEAPDAARVVGPPVRLDPVAAELATGSAIRAAGGIVFEEDGGETI